MWFAGLVRLQGRCNDLLVVVLCERSTSLRLYKLEGRASQGGSFMTNFVVVIPVRAVFLSIRAIVPGRDSRMITEAHSESVPVCPFTTVVTTGWHSSESVNAPHAPPAQPAPPAGEPLSSACRAPPNHDFRPLRRPAHRPRHPARHRAARPGRLGAAWLCARCRRPTWLARRGPGQRAGPVPPPDHPRQSLRMFVAMTNCGEAGWVSDRTGYRYDPSIPIPARRGRAMPEVFRSLAERAAASAGLRRLRARCLPDQPLPARHAALAPSGSRRTGPARAHRLGLARPARHLPLGRPAPCRQARRASGSPMATWWWGAAHRDWSSTASRRWPMTITRSPGARAST